ncbi:MAG: hypothetical protein KZQ57_05400 [gamma proteobacterium symbiont of Lucinoma myriamae]|nr:hypothetical protein [gamma proteobacterium symbiont of Lucinoma myriamae]
MNQAIRTYGDVINLDYSHHPVSECKAVWHKILQTMMLEGFHNDKRMFLITTILDKDSVCDKARHALSIIDAHLEPYNKHSFQYVTDFFTFDMSNYVDLRLPPPDVGVTLKEQHQANTH